MNIRKTINKLQSALIAKGYIYKINTFQFYIEQQNRMITGYRITQKQPYRKKNGEMSVKDVKLFNSCSQVEVLKWFVEKWNEVREMNEEKYTIEQILDAIVQADEEIIVAISHKDREMLEDVLKDYLH